MEEEKATNRIFRGKTHKPRTDVLHSINTACEPNYGASFNELKRQRKSTEAQVHDSLQDFTV